MPVLRLRPYLDGDAEIILSWQRDEQAFYRWSAGMLGSFPPSRQRFDQLGALMRFTALDGEQTTRECRFEGAPGPGEQSFEFAAPGGVCDVTFVFLPGCRFDFEGFRFEPIDGEEE